MTWKVDKKKRPLTFLGNIDFSVVFQTILFEVCRLPLVRDFKLVPHYSSA